MEFNLGMVIASHLKHIVGVGKEHAAASLSVAMN